MSRRAFTLLEVLLALAVVAVLGGAVASTLWNLERRRERIELEHRRQNQAGVLLDALDAAMLCAIAGDARLGTGVSGDAASISVLTRAVAVDAPVAARLAAIQTLRVASADGTVTMSVRAPGSAGAEERFDALGMVRFRFRAEGAWEDTFDSGAKGGLPDGVEVAVWFARPGRVFQESGEPESLPDRLRLIAVPDGGLPESVP